MNWMDLSGDLEIVIGPYEVYEDLTHVSLEGYVYHVLLHEVLMIEAEGNYEVAGIFIEKYRYLNKDTQKALEMLLEVPVDIRPVYPIENQI